MKRFKIIALILALVMIAFTLAACGGENETPNGNEPQSSIDSGSDNGGGSENGSEPDGGSENGSEPENGSENESGSGSADATGVAAAALKLANELIGTQYKSGGTGPDEFDNSGFIYYIFNKSGYKMPRRIPDMAKEGKEVGRNDLKAGDTLDMMTGDVSLFAFEQMQRTFDGLAGLDIGLDAACLADGEVSVSKQFIGNDVGAEHTEKFTALGVGNFNADVGAIAFLGGLEQRRLDRIEQYGAVDAAFALKIS